MSEGKSFRELFGWDAHVLPSKGVVLLPDGGVHTIYYEVVAGVTLVDTEYDEKLGSVLKPLPPDAQSTGENK